jgi:hypothetical protein
MNHAQTVLHELQSINNPSAVEIECGYASRLGYGSQAALHHVFTAPVPRVVSQRRDDSGRCTYALFAYPDGSLLIFNWSEARGARYAVH